MQAMYRRFHAAVCKVEDSDPDERDEAVQAVYDIIAEAKSKGMSAVVVSGWEEEIQALLTLMDM